MPIYRDKKRGTFVFEFDVRIGGERVRATKHLPKTWNRAQADEFDRKESAALYARAQGIGRDDQAIEDAVNLYLMHRATALKHGRNVAAELALIYQHYKGRPMSALPDVCKAIQIKGAGLIGGLENVPLARVDFTLHARDEHVVAAHLHAAFQRGDEVAVVVLVRNGVPVVGERPGHAVHHIAASSDTVGDKLVEGDGRDDDGLFAELGHGFLSVVPAAGRLGIINRTQEVCMFGIFKRHKARMAEVDRKHQQTMEQISRGFREIDTALGLIEQRARGELPPDHIVKIGDGYYVVQNPDGSRTTVIVDRSKVPVARVERFDAAPDRFVAKLETDSPSEAELAWRRAFAPFLVALGDAKVSAFQAKVDEYTRQANLLARRLHGERVAADHVPVNQIPEPPQKPAIPKLEIPEPPRLELPPRPAP
jgi:hypothetical protein